MSVLHCRRTELTDKALGDDATVFCMLGGERGERARDALLRLLRCARDEQAQQRFDTTELGDGVFIGRVVRRE